MADETPEEIPVVPVDDEPISLPQEPSRTQIAQEVIAGKWGRGQARRRRLSDAGHDPDSIQAAVDEIFNR